MGSLLADLVFGVLAAFDIFVLASASIYVAMKISDRRHQPAERDQKLVLVRGIDRLRQSLAHYNADAIPDEPASDLPTPPVPRSGAGSSDEVRLNAAGAMLLKITEVRPDLDPVLAPLNASLDELLVVLPSLKT